MVRIGSRDATLALILGSLGALGVWASTPLHPGEIAHMGPGYLPQAVSWIVIALGSAVGLRALVRGNDMSVAVERVPWRGLLFIGAAILGFALVIRPGGLILASALLVLLCCSAELGARWREKAVLVTGFTAAAALIFVIGLGLPLSLYPAWSL